MLGVFLERIRSLSLMSRRLRCWCFKQDVLCQARLGQNDNTTITARKRSLGQGKIFRAVCQSYSGHGGGHVWQEAYMAGGVCQRGMCAGEMATEAGGTHPTGIHSYYFDINCLNYNLIAS